jgi:DNA-binding MarR family transcriptional regulator
MENYLRETFGLDVKVDKINEDDLLSLPLFFKEEYDLYSMEILGEVLVLLRVKNTIQQIPKIRKHLERIRIELGSEGVLWVEELSANQIRNLVSHNIPFVASGKQIYLPYIGIFLKKGKKKIERSKRVFSPSTQSLFIQLCYRKSFFGKSLSDLAKESNINPMTVSRSVQELVDLKLISVKKMGVEKYIFPIYEGKELFKEGQAYLRKPYGKKVYVPSEKIKCGIPSGEYALSKGTMIGEPTMKTYAVHKKNIDINEHIYTEEEPLIHEGVSELELWTYDPAKLAREGVADPISLFAYMRDIRDERIQLALEELLGGFS